MCVSTLSSDTPEEGIRYHYGCEPPCGCWDLNSGPLEEQSVLLTTEPSLQPCKNISYTHTYTHTHTHTEGENWPLSTNVDKAEATLRTTRA